MNLIESLPSERVFMHGIVDPAEFLNQIDLLVLPYKLNSVPIPPAVLHEAVQCQTPVLISDVAGLAGVYENYCDTFKALDVRSLEESISSKLNT